MDKEILNKITIKMNLCAMTLGEIMGLLETYVNSANELSKKIIELENKNKELSAKINDVSNKGENEL